MAPGSVMFVREWRYHYDEGQTLARAGRYDEARERYERALAAEPNAESEYQLGVLDLHGDAVDSAIARFRKAIQLNPGIAEAHAMLGAALLLKKDYRRAERALREALNFFPDIPEAARARAGTHYNLGQALVAMDRLDEAREQFLAARRLQPDHAGAAEALKRLSGR